MGKCLTPPAAWKVRGAERLEERAERTAATVIMIMSFENTQGENGR